MKKLFVLPLLLSALVGCRPEPIDIEIPQKTGEMVIASAVLNEHTVLVSASYSIDAHTNLEDSTSRSAAATGMLVDSGFVTISTPGAVPDTLKRYSAGIYGSHNLRLQPNTEYTLTVADYRKGTVATATTTYTAEPAIESISPEVVRSESDTVVKLRIRLTNVQPGERYFVCYRNGNANNAVGRIMTATQLQSYEPKKLELISSEEAQHGVLERYIPLALEAVDTLVVQVGKIDKGYFDYLSAYKRSGYLINQLTGEPINMPSNVASGYGYFSLYRPRYYLFDLDKY